MRQVSESQGQVTGNMKEVITVDTGDKQTGGLRKVRGRGAISLMIILLGFLLSFNIYSAATADTKAKMDAAAAEKKQKEQELAESRQTLSQTQEHLADLQVTKNTYQGKMNLLNENLTLVADKLAVLENEIELKEMEIEETLQNLEDAKNTRAEQYESMKQRIRFLYEDGSENYAEILLSANDFGEFLNYADYIEALSAYDRKMLNLYIETEARVRAQEMQLEQEKDELDAYHEEVVAEQQKVNGLISDTARSIAATADSIEDTKAAEEAYENQVLAKQQEAAIAAQEYAAIKAQYEEEVRLSQLAAKSTWRDISQVVFEEGDRYLLANLIYCEAGGEPYAGKLAVGSVVINRLLSNVFPNTLTGVIYQHKQFAPVLDGHLALALANNKANAACYQAADEAMAGMNNVGTRVFFRTPIPGLVGMQIGNHIFY